MAKDKPRVEPRIEKLDNRTKEIQQREGGSRARAQQKARRQILDQQNREWKDSDR